MSVCVRVCVCEGGWMTAAAAAKLANGGMGPENQCSDAENPPLLGPAETHASASGECACVAGARAVEKGEKADGWERGAADDPPKPGDAALADREGTPCFLFPRRLTQTPTPPPTQRMHFMKEDERLLRKLLSKIKAQADAADVHEAAGVDASERSALNSIVGKYNVSPADVEKLMEWKHKH